MERVNGHSARLIVIRFKSEVPPHHALPKPSGSVKDAGKNVPVPGRGVILGGGDLPPKD